MIRIIGDVNFADWYFDMGYGVGTAMSKGQNPFEYLPISNDDFWIGNFECVCADVHGKNCPFVILPDVLGKIPHLNLYGVSNNHVMQAGDDAYDQTLEFLNNKGILYAGTTAQKSVEFCYQGKKIGFLSFSLRPDNFSDSPLYWHLPEFSDIASEIEKLADCDFVIAFIHWGYEFINYPNIDQKKLAHWLIDSGVDLIAGMHPHVAQGYEVYKSKYIFYSIGNAVFNMNWAATHYGLMINIDLKANTPCISCDYIEIGKDGRPRVVSSVPDAYSLNSLNAKIPMEKENELYFADASRASASFRKENRRAIVKDIISFKNRSAFGMVKDFVARKLGMAHN